jgi:hypothetical protein
MTFMMIGSHDERRDWISRPPTEGSIEEQANEQVADR